jgi:hypothetical protein
MTNKAMTMRQVNAFTKKVERRCERANALWDKYYELDRRSAYNEVSYSRVYDARSKYDAHIRESIKWLHETGVCGPEGVSETDRTHPLFLNFICDKALLVFSDGSWS